MYQYSVVTKMPRQKLEIIKIEPIDDTFGTNIEMLELTQFGRKQLIFSNKLDKVLQKAHIKVDGT